MCEKKMTKREAKKYAAGLASGHLNTVLERLEVEDHASTRTRCAEDHRQVLDALHDIVSELSRRSLRGK